MDGVQLYHVHERTVTKFKLLRNFDNGKYLPKISWRRNGGIDELDGAALQVEGVQVHILDAPLLDAAKLNKQRPFIRNSFQLPINGATLHWLLLNQICF